MRRAWFAILLLSFFECANDSPPPCEEGPHVRWPSKPNAAAAVPGEPVTYAIDALLLGDARRGETTTSASAWETFGFDLDNLVTPRCGKPSCKVAGGAIAKDPDGGIDNRFGEAVLPLFSFGEDHPSQAVSKIIRHGGFTLQIQIRGLDPSVTNQTATDLQVSAFPSHTFDPTGRYPYFIILDDWPVRSDVVVDGASVASGAKESFPAYIVNGTLVMQADTFTFGIVAPNGVPVDIPLRKAVLTMDVRGNDGDNGTIAGVVDPIAMQRITDLVMRCTTSLFSDLVRSFPDIMIDGTNGPGTCDAISFAVGFTAKRIANPTRVRPPLSVPPCPDAGTDAATDAKPDVLDAGSDSPTDADE